MRIVRQPVGADHLCGQCVVATIAQVELDEAIAAVGHQKPTGTRTTQLAKALQKLGVATRGTRLRRVIRNGDLPSRAIVSCRRWVPRDGYLQEEWHWMLWWDGSFRDPDGNGLNYYMGGGWRVTSYIEILQ